MYRKKNKNKKTEKATAFFCVLCFQKKLKWISAMTCKQTNKTTTTTYILKMAITRSMSVPISAKKEKYVKELSCLRMTHERRGTNNNSTPTTERRIVMIKVFKFLNTNGLRIFGFSGSEGKFIKTMHG